MARSIVWTLDWEGKTYTYDADEDLTVGVLRHVRQWFPELGTFGRMSVAFPAGDPDACAVVLWVMKRKAGESPPDPTRCEDFPIGRFLNQLESPLARPCRECGGKGWSLVEAEPVPLDSTPTSPSPSDTSTETPTISEAST